MSRISGESEGATTAAELACVGPLGATDVQTALNVIALSASLPTPGSSGNLLTSNGAAWVSAAPATPNVSTVTGTLALANGGTGANSASGARQALLPSPSAGLPLVSDGATDASFSTIAFGTATTGTVSIGRGGSGQTTALTAFAALAPAPGSAGRVMVSDGSVNWTASALAISATTGTLALDRGGTGLTSSGAAGNVLRSNGAALVSAALAVADVSGAAPSASPTLTGVVAMSGASSVTVPTVTPATDSTTKAASTAFTQAAILAAADPFAVQILIDHGQTGTFAGQLGWVGIANGGGSLATFNSASVAGADGHRTLNAGTTANGRSAMCFEATAGQLPLLQPWLRGPYTQEWLFQIPLLSTAGAADFEFGVSLGAGASTNNTSFVSGFGVFCSGTAPVWQFASRNAGVPVATASTSVSAIAATWTYVRIELYTAGATGARCYIGTGSTAAASKAAAGTTAVATITTVGATTLALGPMAKTSNLVGSSTARNTIVALFASQFAPA